MYVCMYTSMQGKVTRLRYNFLMLIMWISGMIDKLIGTLNLKPSCNSSFIPICVTQSLRIVWKQTHSERTVLQEKNEKNVYL